LESWKEMFYLSVIGVCSLLFDVFNPVDEDGPYL
jgi:hypothetical protein